MKVLAPREVSARMSVGSVASAVLTKKGSIYTGICIDTDSSLGMCAERNALATMLTQGEQEVERVLSVYRDGSVIPSCGACREFMLHLGEGAADILILLDKDGRCKRLIELMPEADAYK